MQLLHGAMGRAVNSVLESMDLKSPICLIAMTLGATCKDYTCLVAIFVPTGDLMSPLYWILCSQFGKDLIMEQQDRTHFKTYSCKGVTNPSPW